ncbi:hypothetical protein [Microcystis aeruginosa]|jgi:hypothetical protein|uniref:hypothetical protein n=1 Tax=Microcystis aeruginosa TaxID=1126 RepID=UPI0012BB14D0|nr:hypothetical protein [Microcystis aeruginosa]
MPSILLQVRKRVSLENPIDTPTPALRDSWFNESTFKNLAFLWAIASGSPPHVLEYIWISPIDIYYNSRKLALLVFVWKEEE